MYKCPICSEKFKSLSRIKLHIRFKHPRVYTVCPICGFEGDVVKHASAIVQFNSFDLDHAYLYLLLSRHRAKNRGKRRAILKVLGGINER